MLNWIGCKFDKRAKINRFEFREEAIIMYSVLTRLGDSLFAPNHCSWVSMSTFKFSWAFCNNSSAVDILVSAA